MFEIQNLCFGNGVRLIGLNYKYKKILQSKHFVLYEAYNFGIKIIIITNQKCRFIRKGMFKIFGDEMDSFIIIIHKRRKCSFFK